MYFQAGGRQHENGTDVLLEMNEGRKFKKEARKQAGKFEITLHIPSVPTAYSNDWGSRNRSKV